MPVASVLSLTGSLVHRHRIGTKMNVDKYEAESERLTPHATGNAEASEQWKKIADDCANEFILRLRQWQGYPLTDYQQQALRASYLTAMERAKAAQIPAATSWQEI